MVKEFYSLFEMNFCFFLFLSTVSNVSELGMCEQLYNTVTSSVDLKEILG